MRSKCLPGALVGVLLLASAPACTPAEGSPSPGVDEGDEPELRPDEAGVEFRRDLERIKPCADEGGSQTCIAAYLRLIHERMGADFDLAGCIDETTVEVERFIRDVEDGRVATWEETVTADELAEHLLQELAIQPLLDALEGHRNIVTTFSESDQGSYVEELWAVEDPIAGEIMVRALIPKGDGRRPAILGQPGHPESPDQTLEFADRHHGRAYAEAGYLVLIPAFRGYDTGPAEHEATAGLLCAGLSLTAMKNYESALMMRVLEAMQQDGRVGPVALVGHSGGSVAGNVFIRHDWRAAAWVTDLSSSYLNVQPCPDTYPRPYDRCLIDETAPKLYPPHPRVNDPNNPIDAVPTFVQEYGYPDGPGEVFEFLAQHLGTP